MQFKTTVLLALLAVGAFTFNTCVCPEKEAYFEKDNECLSPDETVDDCIAYTVDGTGKKFTCVGCDSGYYMKEKKCNEVKDTVDNCKTYIDNKKCQICEDGYYYKDATHCVAYPDTEEKGKTDNCLTYRAGQGDKAVCQSCEEGYYIDGSKCKEITKVDNCMTYNGKDCGICDEGFYLKSKKCEADPTEGDNYVEDCARYQYQQDKPVCLGCKGERALKTKDNKKSCIDATAVDNCAAYAVDGDNTKCSGCEASTKIVMKSGKITECVECPYKPGFGSVLQFGLALLAFVALLI